jgi:hypothetical protein
MESKLVKLKSDFNNVITIRNSVKNIFDILQVKINKLKLFYSEFIKNNQTEMFVFGLDSFHFQSKLIDIEYDDMKRLFLAINNRMYCEYFKLNKIIIDYIQNNINDKKIKEVNKFGNFPIYKDLEPFKEYKFEIILEIHENILHLLSVLTSILNNKENELSIHITKKNIGLNIDNFITSFTYNNVVMREKIMMFITYIEFFHKLHTKYLKRFSNKIQLMYLHINNDIKFDDSVEINKNKRKELMDEIGIENLDSKLIRDIKKSMGSESISSESEYDINHIIKLHNNLNSPSNFDSDSNSNFSNNSDTIGNNIEYKKNIREMITKNISKVKSIIKLCNQKEEKVIVPLTNNIDKILNDDNDENIGLFIDKIENENFKNIENKIEEEKFDENVLNIIEEKEVVIEEKEVVIEEKDFLEEERKIPEKKVIIEEPKNNETLLNIIEEKEIPKENLSVTIDDNQNEVAPKKKRAYNKKKK